VSDAVARERGPGPRRTALERSGHRDLLHEFHAGGPGSNDRVSSSGHALSGKNFLPTGTTSWHLTVNRLPPLTQSHSALPPRASGEARDSPGSRRDQGPGLRLQNNLDALVLLGVKNFVTARSVLQPQPMGHNEAGINIPSFNPL
jgi:hypothetical protein